MICTVSTPVVWDGVVPGSPIEEEPDGSFPTTIASLVVLGLSLCPGKVTCAVSCCTCSFLLMLDSRDSIIGPVAPSAVASYSVKTRALAAEGAGIVTDATSV